MQRRKDVETRKEEAFVVIAEIIAEQGITYVTTKGVAQKLGVSQPALYKYFKDRDEMLIGFLDYMIESLVEISDRINRLETSEERLYAFYHEQLTLIEKTKMLPKVLFFEEFHLDHGRKRDKLRELVNIYEAGIQEIVVEGINRQEIMEVNPSTALQFIKGSILSAYLNWILAGMNYSLVGEKDKFMAFLKQSILK